MQCFFTCNAIPAMCCGVRSEVPSSSETAGRTRRGVDERTTRDDSRSPTCEEERRGEQRDDDEDKSPRLNDSRLVRHKLAVGRPPTDDVSRRRYDEHRSPLREHVAMTREEEEEEEEGEEEEEEEDGVAGRRNDGSERLADRVQFAEREIREQSEGHAGDTSPPKQSPSVDENSDSDDFDFEDTDAWEEDGCRETTTEEDQHAMSSVNSRSRGNQSLVHFLCRTF